MRFQRTCALNGVNNRVGATPPGAGLVIKPRVVRVAIQYELESCVLSCIVEYEAPITLTHPPTPGNEGRYVTLRSDCALFCIVFQLGSTCQGSVPVDCVHPSVEW